MTSCVSVSGCVQATGFWLLHLAPCQPLAASLPKLSHFVLLCAPSPKPQFLIDDGPCTLPTPSYSFKSVALPIRNLQLPPDSYCLFLLMALPSSCTSGCSPLVRIQHRSVRCLRVCLACRNLAFFAAPPLVTCFSVWPLGESLLLVFEDIPIIYAVTQKTFALWPQVEHVQDTPGCVCPSSFSNPNLN